jgi:hypothetical protein
MRRIAEDNPGAVLVFATLAQEFSARDKQLLTPFVRACRKYGKMDRPKNPVLLLTGIELFSGFGPPQCWRDAGGHMKAFADANRAPNDLIALCDATQQLHLGLPSWGRIGRWNSRSDARSASANIMPNGFSIRDFLRTRKAVLVHFSTVMARRADLVFPNDLTRAMGLRDTPLSFSTIEIGDTSPDAGRGGAEGCIGLLVDLGTDSRVSRSRPEIAEVTMTNRAAVGGRLGQAPLDLAPVIAELQASGRYVTAGHRKRGVSRRLAAAGGLRRPSATCSPGSERGVNTYRTAGAYRPHCRCVPSSADLRLPRGDGPRRACLSRSRRCAARAAWCSCSAPGAFAVGVTVLDAEPAAIEDKREGD